MRFRHRAAAGFASLLLPLAGLVGLASPAQAATTATATFTKTSDWGTGFGGQWTVKNTGTTAISTWTVEWDFRHPLDREEQVLQRHHRRGRLRLLRLQRRRLRLALQLQAERRQL